MAPSIQLALACFDDLDSPFMVRFGICNTQYANLGIQRWLSSTSRCTGSRRCSTLSVAMKHTAGRVQWVVSLISSQRRVPINTLVRTTIVILHFPKAVNVTTLFRVNKVKLVKHLFVIGSVASFDDPILPRGSQGTSAVFKAAFRYGHLKRSGPVSIAPTPTDKLQGIVGPNQPKRREGILGSAHYVSNGHALVVGMDLRMFESGTQVDKRYLVFITMVPGHRRQLLNI